MTLGEVVRRGGGQVQTGPFGSQLHASDYVQVGVPFIMPVNIGENRIIEEGIARITEEDAKRLSRHRIKAGDIIYSWRGDVERRALVRAEQQGLDARQRMSDGSSWRRSCRSGFHFILPWPSSNP